MLKDGEDYSPVLCQHWGGNEFHEEVREWIAEHYKKSHGSVLGNDVEVITDRWEMNRIFVRLVQRFGDEGYVERERDSVDDSDYGCLVIDVSGKPKFSKEG
jgi:hypothetical protein